MKKISSGSYLNSMRVHFLPFVVWISTIAIVVVLFSHRSQRYEILGVAQSPVYHVAATIGGRIRVVEAGLFDEVKKDQLLVVLDAIRDSKDPEPKLDADLATLQAQLGHLVAETELAKREYESLQKTAEAQHAAAERPFATNANAARLLVMQLTGAISTDQLASRQLDIDIERFFVDGRLDVNDLAIFDLRKMKERKAAALQRIESNQELLNEAEANLTDAEQRQTEFSKKYRPNLSESELAAEDVFAKRTDVLARQMDEVRVRIESLKVKEAVELRAPFDGVVSVVQRNVGEVLMAGDPVLTIAKAEPDNIVAYTTEEQAGRVTKNMEVQLIDRNSRPNVLVASQVVYVGPTVEQMPARLWRNPNAPQWGRPILIKVPTGLKLLPGAIIGIKGI